MSKDNDTRSINASSEGKRHRKAEKRDDKMKNIL